MGRRELRMGAVDWCRATGGRRGMMYIFQRSRNDKRHCASKKTVRVIDSECIGVLLRLIGEIKAEQK